MRRLPRVFMDAAEKIIKEQAERDPDGFMDRLEYIGNSFARRFGCAPEEAFRALREAFNASDLLRADFASKYADDPRVAGDVR